MTFSCFQMFTCMVASRPFGASLLAVTQAPLHIMAMVRPCAQRCKRDFWGGKIPMLKVYNTSPLHGEALRTA